MGLVLELGGRPMLTGGVCRVLAEKWISTGGLSGPVQMRDSSGQTSK